MKKGTDHTVPASLLRPATAFLLFAAIAVLASGGDKKKAVEKTFIEGTVFHEPGLSLPGATVTVMRRDDPKHKKLAQETTSEIGEFKIQIPSTPAFYVVRVSAKGYRTEEKEAQVTGLDLVEVTFNLAPEVKK